MTAQERTALDDDPSYADWLSQRMREPIAPSPALPEHRRVPRYHLRGRNGALVRDSMCAVCRNGEPYLD